MYITSCAAGNVIGPLGLTCIPTASCTGGGLSTSSGMCVCPGGLRVGSDGSACVALCNDDEFDETNNGRTICIKISARTCDGSFSNLKFVNKATTYCAQSCPSNFEAYSYGATCACSHDRVESADGNSCPSTCASNSEIIPVVGKKCVSGCGSDTISSDSSRCLFQCPASQLYNQGYTACYASCGSGNPTFLDLKGERCLSACNAEGSLIPLSGNQCSTSCASGEEANSGSCVACSSTNII